MDYKIGKKGIIVCVLLNVVVVVYIVLHIAAFYMIMKMSYNFVTALASDVETASGIEITDSMSLPGVNLFEEDESSLFDDMDEAVDEVVYNDTIDNVVLYSQYTDTPVYYIEDYSGSFASNLIREQFDNYVMESTILDDYVPQDLWCFVEESENVCYICEVSDYSFDEETYDVSIGNITKIFRFEYNPDTCVISITDERGE